MTETKRDRDGDSGLGEKARRELIGAALAARRFSYSPYSGYQVGAALLTESGRIFTGCNVENAAFGPTVCAERTAVFKAVSEGETKFAALAVTGSPRGKMTQFSWPCGVCRQVLAEFCDPERMEILVAKSEEDYESRSLGALLPEGFGPGNLAGFKEKEH